MEKNIEIFKDIDSKVDELKERIKELIINSNENELFQEKKKELDLRILDNEQPFVHLVYRKKNNIKKILSESNDIKVEKLLNHFLEEVLEEIQYLSLDSIGTTLNWLREFYFDLEDYLIRITKEE